MKFKLLLATLTLVLSTGAMAESAKDAIKAAKAAQKEASSLGFEWRDMGKTIKKAEAAAKDGKDKKAIKLANKIYRCFRHLLQPNTSIAYANTVGEFY